MVLWDDCEISKLHVSKGGNVLTKKLHPDLRAIFNLARDWLEESLYSLDAFPDRQGRHKHGFLLEFLIVASRDLECKPVHDHLMDPDVSYARLIIRLVSSYSLF